MSRLSSKRGVSESDLSSYLETLGYADVLNKVLVSRILEARSGVLEKPDWVKMEEEASSLLEKSKETDKRSLQLVQEAKSLRTKVENDLKPKLESAEQEKNDAESAAKKVLDR